MLRGDCTQRGLTASIHAGYLDTLTQHFAPSPVSTSGIHCADLSFSPYALPSAQDFIEEQGQVARLIMQLRAEGADDQIAVLRAARERFAEGGPGR